MSQQLSHQQMPWCHDKRGIPLGHTAVPCMVNSASRHALHQQPCNDSLHSPQLCYQKQQQRCRKLCQASSCASKQHQSALRLQPTGYSHRTACRSTLAEKQKTCTAGNRHPHTVLLTGIHTRNDASQQKMHHTQDMHSCMAAKATMGAPDMKTCQVLISTRQHSSIAPRSTSSKQQDSIHKGHTS